MPQATANKAVRAGVRPSGSDTRAAGAIPSVSMVLLEIGMLMLRVLMNRRRTGRLLLMQYGLRMKVGK
jgi:hypothetical protein